MFLSELRRAFSETWHKKFLRNGESLLSSPTTFSAATSAPASLSEEDLYDIRRDAEAVPYTSAATSKVPAVGTAEAASLRLRMLEKGALAERSWLRLDGKTIRIVNGAGRNLEDVKKLYKEPPTFADADFVVCAGAKALGVPTGLISRGTPGGLIRPAAGSGSRWITSEEAEYEFKL